MRPQNNYQNYPDLRKNQISYQSLPNFRPLPSSSNRQAQSYSNSYLSQSSSIQSDSQRQPLIYRSPVPQGLLQSIGQTVYAQDNGIKAFDASQHTYLPPATNELPVPSLQLVVPISSEAQAFQGNSDNFAAPSTSYTNQNPKLSTKNVHIIHDCSKASQIQQSFELPIQSLDVPQYKNVNSAYNSYLPPTSHHDVVGSESRGNVAIIEPQTTNEAADKNQLFLPENSNVAINAGSDFTYKGRTQTLIIPPNQLPEENIKLYIQSSNLDFNQKNKRDSQTSGHQQILADGLLQSIITAIEKQPQKVHQVPNETQINHMDAKTFLKSRQGQSVLIEDK